MDQKLFSGRREPDTRSAAMEKRVADLILEAVHLHAERRLGAPHFQRCKADRARARNDAEAAKQGKIKKLHAINPVDTGLKQYQFASSFKQI
ncbi:hypothetical protein GCM10007908_32950 [Rhizobium albus]|nr:hypothetical protein GCM10007908_32950 [Rhizobium albus]